MKTTPPPSGDYGYDLVHDDVRRGSVHADQEQRPVARTAERDREPDSGEDLGYDEAHDF